jgi:hypothetical protein
MARPLRSGGCSPGRNWRWTSSQSLLFGYLVHVEQAYAYHSATLFTWVGEFVQTGQFPRR